MNILLWVVAALLALVFLISGITKLARPKDKLAASSMAWAEEFPAAAVKTIGALELLGALGLILPAATGIAPILTPLAALGLALVMVGAAITHGRRKEAQPIVVNIILLVLTALVAWGRFGPYTF